MNLYITFAEYMSFFLDLPIISDVNNILQKHCKISVLENI